MSDNTKHIETFVALTDRELGEAKIGDVPEEARVAFTEATEQVGRVKALATTYDEKLDSLSQVRRQGGVTEAGYSHQLADTRQVAVDMHRQAERAFERATARTEDLLMTAALPTITSDGRESLARQEFDTALGDARGSDVGPRVLGIASNGSPEVQAVLGTPYARTKLIAAGAGSVDRILRDARRAVAYSVDTPEAVSARSGLEALGKLTGAMSGAQGAFRTALDI
jgi:hypothetical protein